MAFTTSCARSELPLMPFRNCWSGGGQFRGGGGGTQVSQPQMVSESQGLSCKEPEELGLWGVLVSTAAVG